MHTSGQEEGNLFVPFPLMVSQALWDGARWCAAAAESQKESSPGTAKAWEKLAELLSDANRKAARIGHKWLNGDYH